MPAKTPTRIANVALVGVTNVQLASDCALVKIWGYNADAADGFFQVHDSAIALVGAEIPIITVPVPSLITVSFDFSDRPWEMLNGLIIAWSTTGPTYTAGPAGWVTGEALT